MMAELVDANGELVDDRKHTANSDPAATKIKLFERCGYTGAARAQKYLSKKGNRVISDVVEFVVAFEAELSHEPLKILVVSDAEDIGPLRVLEPELLILCANRGASNQQPYVCVKQLLFREIINRLLMRPENLVCSEDGLIAKTVKIMNT